MPPPPRRNINSAPLETDVNDDGYGDLEIVPGQEELAASREAQERQNEAMLSGQRVESPDQGAGFDDGLTRLENAPAQAPAEPPQDQTPEPPPETRRAPEADELATEERLRQPATPPRRQRRAPQAQTPIAADAETQTRPSPRARREQQAPAQSQNETETSEAEQAPEPERARPRVERGAQPVLTIQNIIEKFRERGELGELDERFLEARQAFLDGKEGENGRDLREAYLRAGENLQKAMEATVRRRAGIRGIDREPELVASFIPNAQQINEAFSRDEEETFSGWENRLKGTTAEASEDQDVETLFAQFPGEVPLLKERFLAAREAYLHATKKKREKLEGTTKNIRLSPHEAKLRDSYLASRNDLLYALASIARPGAGFTKTEKEKARGEVDKGVAMGAVLDTLIDGEQRVLGEDGFSTLHAYDSFEKTILNDIRKRAKDAGKEIKGREKDTLRPLVTRDLIERGDSLDALATTVSLKREAFRNRVLEQRLSLGKKRMVDPMRVGLRKNPGFFSWIEDIFGRTPRPKS
jgi:hypothetical protein